MKTALLLLKISVLSHTVFSRHNFYCVFKTQFLPRSCSFATDVVVTVVSSFRYEFKSRLTTSRQVNRSTCWYLMSDLPLFSRRFLGMTRMPLLPIRKLPEVSLTKLRMRSPYFADLNVLFLLADVSYRCRKCCIFLSFSHSFHQYAPFYAVAIVRFDIFSSIKET